MNQIVVVVLDKIGKERSKKLKNVISRGSENEVFY